jgi:hypothetical protein
MPAPQRTTAIKKPVSMAPVHTSSADQQPPAAQPYPVTLLSDAAHIILQRGVERDTGGAGQPQERSMAATVAAFNAIEGTTLTERQGWAFMQTLKLVRAANTARNGRYNPDDYQDGAAYAALGAEAAANANANIQQRGQA